MLTWTGVWISGWADDDDKRVEQLVHEGGFHSLGRLDHRLVLVGMIAELGQLTRAQLLQLQLHCKKLRKKYFLETC